MYTYLVITHSLIIYFVIVVNMLANLWRKKPPIGEIEQWTFHMPEKLDSFKAKYDSIQDQLKEQSGLDDLLAGTLR